MAQNLQQEGSTQSTNALLTALGVEDKLARQKEIAEILDELSEDKAVTLLFDALLKSVNNESRGRVVEELARLGSPNAVELLKSIMTDDFDSAVRRRALEALRQIGTDHAIDALLSVLYGSDEVLRWEAARALGDFGSDKVVNALIEFTESPFLRIDPAIFSLAKIGSDTATEHLVTLMNDLTRSDVNSYYAMQALVRLGTEKAVDGILHGWISPISILGDRLYFHLRQVKPKKLIKPLCQRLRDKSQSTDIRKAAAEMLGIVGTENEIPLLESIWQDWSEETDKEVGWRALRAAEQISFEELKRKQERERALEETRGFIAHEFRHALTPLNAYVKMLDGALAQPEINKEKLLSLTSRIRKQTNTAFDLVDQYMDYSRPLKPEFTQIHIGDLLQQSLEEFKEDLENRRISVLFDAAESVSVSVDKRMLSQVLRNIIANSIQAIDHDGTLTVSTRLYEDDLVLAITDTGAGVNPEHLSRLFEVGFTTKSSVRGAGIGLALSKRIIEEAHGGSIAITKNTDSPGVTVTISLPRKRMEIRNGRRDLTLADR
jgi:signal transduction histidine kinase